VTRPRLWLTFIAAVASSACSSGRVCGAVDSSCDDPGLGGADGGNPIIPDGRPAGGRDAPAAGGPDGPRPDAGDPCTGVTCSGHGTCSSSGAGGTAMCNCDTGYHSTGILCIPNGTSDLCGGLVTDTAAHPMTAVTQPSVGQAYTDPQFGTTIRRLTAIGGTGKLVPMYSPVQAWNADETYMILYQVEHGHRLYDGHTYQFIRDLDIHPPDVEQVYWSTSDPDILYWIATNQVMVYRVSTDKNTLLNTIPSCSGQVTADSHAWISWDSTYLGLLCEPTSKAFMYNLKTNTVLGSATGDSAPYIGADGQLAYWDGVVVDQSMTTVRTLDLATSVEHASLGMLANGHDTYNRVAFDPGPHGSGVGSLVTYDLTDGSSRVIVGPDTGYPYPPTETHLSAQIYKRPGWVFVSIIGDFSGATVLSQEIILADTNPGGKVCRIAHHHSHGDDYWGEPHVSGSPSGTRAIFGSDWGGQASIDTYVIELPTYSAP